MRARLPILAFALCVATSGVAFAQLQSGTIAGTISDEQGGVLPGVLVTLTSVDRTATFSTAEDGRFRFLALPPGMSVLSATLPGFTTIIREQIEVRVGQNVEIPITMRVAAIQESITVTGESPLVDSKAMGTSTNFTQDELAKIPTSRDPSRMAAQIVTGVGFLGAGTILHQRGTVHGLTTAASLWVAAAIGTAVAVGMYLMSIETAALAWALLRFGPRVESSD